MKGWSRRTWRLSSVVEVLGLGAQLGAVPVLIVSQPEKEPAALVQEGRAFDPVRDRIHVGVPVAEGQAA